MPQSNTTDPNRLAIPTIVFPHDNSNSSNTNVNKNTEIDIDTDEILRRARYRSGGINNFAFAGDDEEPSSFDQKSVQPFAILKAEDKSQKKAPTPKWQKQLSTFHTGISHQKFSEQQKKTLRSYSSANYVPAHSLTYVKWMKIHRGSVIARLDLDRWFLILLIGVCVGLVATLLKQCIQGLSTWQWKTTRSHMNEQSIGVAFVYLAGTNVIMILVGAVIVTMFHPEAIGGGAVEIIAFLNGIKVHRTLSIKNLVAKFSANVLSVGSGLPTAVQGPLITYGAIIGAGIGQFQSKPFHFRPKLFERFRNAEDQRMFTTDGVAAGVSAGFHSPIGGLLFAMEDLSSFWSKRLSWQTFFCSVVATSVAQMFNTAFGSFKFTPPFGYFFMSVVVPIQMHVLMFLPSILLGIVGGLLGALFTRLAVLINQTRKEVLAKIENVRIQQLLRVAEPCIIVILMTAYTVFLPLAVPCRDKEAAKALQETITNYSKDPFEKIRFERCSNCPRQTNTTTYYNEMATLIQGGGTSYLDMLWSRHTFYVFEYSTCLLAFLIYFPLTIWTAGTAIAGGIFVPVLVSGSLLGRALGSGFMHAYQTTTGLRYPNNFFAWIDPGVMAAVGAAALLSGVNRLEVASTVILVEMVGDINLVLPVLIAIFVAKSVAGKLSKPLYKYQLEGKALPYLDSEPELVIHGKLVNMELWTARDIMVSPVITIETKVNINKVSQLLLQTKHSGFPVVKYNEEAKVDVVCGIISRSELYSILSNETIYKIYHENTSPDAVIDPDIPYEELDSERISNIERVHEILRSYTMKKDINTRINLDLFLSISVTKVDGDYSLLRTYRLFRTMGLRQLLVIDSRNRAIGIITRKDLMQFNMQETLEKLVGQEIPGSGTAISLPGMGQNNSGTPCRSRRMSRRFSVEEGSILGTVVEVDAEVGSSDDDAVIELPAVTRNRKSQMETIKEEDNVNHSETEKGNNNNNNNKPEIDACRPEKEVEKINFNALKLKMLKGKRRKSKAESLEGDVDVERGIFNEGVKECDEENEEDGEGDSRKRSIVVVVENHNTEQQQQQQLQQQKQPQQPQQNYDTDDDDSNKTTTTTFPLDIDEKYSRKF